MASHKSSTQSLHSSQARLPMPWTAEDLLLPSFSKPLCLRLSSRTCTWIREGSVGIQVGQIQSFRSVGIGGCVNRDMVESILMVAGFPGGHSRTHTSFRYFPNFSRCSFFLSGISRDNKSPLFWLLDPGKQSGQQPPSPWQGGHGHG